MKTIVILILTICFILSGCANYNELIKKVPLAEFESFTYHRAGNMTSAIINVKGARIKEGVISFDYVHITGDYGPFVNFDIQLRHYRREISEIKEKRNE